METNQLFVKSLFVTVIVIFIGAVGYYYYNGRQHHQDLFDLVKSDFTKKYPDYEFIECGVGERDQAAVYVHVRFKVPGRNGIQEEVWQYWDMDSTWVTRDSYQSLTRPPEKEPTKTLLHVNKVTHHFSSPVSVDTFKIALTGKSLTDGEVELEIRTGSGLVIFYEKFPSNYLIGYGLDANASIAERDEYIKKRIDTFFDEEHFRVPAIGKDEKFDADYNFQDSWDDIQSDSTAIRFDYLIGEEGIGAIAYSKKQSKVITIFSCC